MSLNKFSTVWFQVILILLTSLLVACGEDREAADKVSSTLGNSIIEELNNQNICESYKDCMEKLGQEWITHGGGYKNSVTYHFFIPTHIKLDFQKILPFFEKAHQKTGVKIKVFFYAGTHQQYRDGTAKKMISVNYN